MSQAHAVMGQADILEIYLPGSIVLRLMLLLLQQTSSSVWHVAFLGSSFSPPILGWRLWLVHIWQKLIALR